MLHKPLSQSKTIHEISDLMPPSINRQTIYQTINHKIKTFTSKNKLDYVGALLYNAPSKIGSLPSL